MAGALAGGFGVGFEECADDGLAGEGDEDAGDAAGEEADTQFGLGFGEDAACAGGGDDCRTDDQYQTSTPATLIRTRRAHVLLTVPCRRAVEQICPQI